MVLPRCMSFRRSRSPDRDADNTEQTRGPMFRCMSFRRTLSCGLLHHENVVEPRGFVSNLINVRTLSTTEEVEDFLAMNSKSVLYFSATWCRPCKEIKPVYDDLAKKHGGHGIGFGRIEIDDMPGAEEDYDINAVPTFIFFVGETQTERFSGMDPSKLEELVEGFFK